MDVMLQEHGAKHVYRVPEGLRELCSDISREVLRSQPRDIYCYIADYVDALLITRENAKVAVRVVNNILLGSEAIVAILNRTGLSLGQIAVAAPRLQKAFRSYLDTVDVQPIQVCEDKNIEDESRVSIRNILESTGAPLDASERAATMIQTAFRGHYERMLEREANGDIQWQRAARSTTEILKRAGVSQKEAEEAATLIQSAYRGYYSRRNMKMKLVEEEADEQRRPRLASDLPESRKTIQAVAWLDMMYEDSGLDGEGANEVATLIQSSYRGSKTQRRCYDLKRISSSPKSLVVDAIVDNVRQRIIEKVLSSRENIPQEFENEAEAEVVAEKIENAYKERLRESRLSSEIDNDGIYEDFAVNDGEIEAEEDRDKNETKASRESIDNLTEEIRIENKEIRSHEGEHDVHEEDQGE